MGGYTDSNSEKLKNSPFGLKNKIKNVLYM